MSRLFRRVVNLTVAPRAANSVGNIAGGYSFSNLDCSFRVTKSLKEEPNTADIRIFNIATESRALLQQAERIIVRLDAGYEDRLCQLYRGELRSAVVTYEGSDVVTHIESGDSEKELQQGHINLSVGKNSPANFVLLQIVQALNVGQGNAAQFASRLAGFTYGPGTLIFGSAADAMTDFCDSFDLAWSIQDGVIQILEKGEALNSTAVLLTPDSGLIGSPTIDHKNVLTAKALIQPSATTSARSSRPRSCGEPRQETTSTRSPASRAVRPRSSRGFCARTSPSRKSANAWPIPRLLIMRVSRRDIDAGYSAALTNVQRIDGPELQPSSCACYANRAGDGKADSCECHRVVDTAHGPRWRSTQNGHADSAGSALERARREMHERHGSGQAKTDAGEEVVERARQEMIARHLNAWRK